MKLTEEQVKQIIRKETLKYLEEIKALDPELYKQVLQKIKSTGKGAYEKGYIPFTEPHRKASRHAMAEETAWEVMLMVYGDPKTGTGAEKDWPELPQDRETVKEYLTQLHGYPEDEIFDLNDNPLIPWYEVQKLAVEEKLKFKQQQQLAEIIKKEVIKYLKENE